MTLHIPYKLKLSFVAALMITTIGCDPDQSTSKNQQNGTDSSQEVDLNHLKDVNDQDISDMAQQTVKDADTTNSVDMIHDQSNLTDTQTTDISHDLGSDILLNTPCDKIGEFKDIRYATLAGVDANLHSLDIYVPDHSPETRLPVMIYVHGGGWSIGDKKVVHEKPKLFNDAGYIFVSINYRLSPDPPSAEAGALRYPKHNRDVARAIGWVYKNIADYCANPEQMALIGHSAGAHMVASVSTDESFLQGVDLDLKNISCAIVNDTEGYDIPNHLSDPTTSEGAVLLYKNAFGNNPETWAKASPITHVESGKGIPKHLVIYRGQVNRQDKAKAFAKALSDAGIDAETYFAEGLSHAEVNQNLGNPDDLTSPVILKFLENCF